MAYPQLVRLLLVLLLAVPSVASAQRRVQQYHAQMAAESSAVHSAGATLYLSQPTRPMTRGERTMTGVIIGAVSGAAIVGGIIMVQARRPCDWCVPPPVIAGAVVGGGVVGGVIGGLIARRTAPGK